MDHLKKIISYELKLETFKDSNSDGIGDFNGLLQKINYLKSLNVNVVFIDDVLKQYQNVTNVNEVNNKYGSLQDFINIVQTMQKSNIMLSPIIDLKDIKQLFLNWKNMMELYSDSFSTTKEIEWNSLQSKYLINNIDPNNNIVDLANFILYLDKVVNFYNECGIRCFTFKNFEILLKYDEFTKHSNLEKLEDLYKTLKRININAIMILQPKSFNKQLFKNILSYDTKYTDYLYLNLFSLININIELPYTKKTPLNLSKFLNEYKFAMHDKRIIMCLESDASGKINSMWGDEKAYMNEAANSFLLTLFSGKNSIGLYSGFELGQNRAKWIELNNNFAKNEEKRYYESKKITKEAYFEAKKYQSKENMEVIMSWNNTDFCGFSDYNMWKFSPALNYYTNNVKTEQNDPNSCLNFYIFLTNFIKDKTYLDSLDKSSISVKKINDILFIKRKYNKQTLKFIYNLTNKPRKLFPQYGNYKLITSSYVSKIYASLPKYLEPFESIIIINDN